MEQKFGAVPIDEFHRHTRRGEDLRGGDDETTRKGAVLVGLLCLYVRWGRYTINLVILGSGRDRLEVGIKQKFVGLI